MGSVDWAIFDFFGSVIRQNTLSWQFSSLLWTYHTSHTFPAFASYSFKQCRLYQLSALPRVLCWAEQYWAWFLCVCFFTHRVVFTDLLSIFSFILSYLETNKLLCLDERGPITTDKYAPIHADAPPFVEMSVEQEILATGIKVVDLLAPYVKGKLRMFFFLRFLSTRRRWYKRRNLICRWCICVIHVCFGVRQKGAATSYETWDSHGWFRSFEIYIWNRVDLQMCDLAVTDLRVPCGVFIYCCVIRMCVGGRVFKTSGIN